MPAYLCAAAVAAAHPTAERWTTDLASFAARTGLREFAVRAYVSRRELGDPRRSTQLACSRQASRARTCRRSWTYREGSLLDDLVGVADRAFAISSARPGDAPGTRASAG